MQNLLTNKFVAGAITGLITAAWVDFRAFRSWKSFDEATKYDWKTAGLRWVQGAVAGLLAAAGLGGLGGA